MDTGQGFWKLLIMLYKLNAEILFKTCGLVKLTPHQRKFGSHVHGVHSQIVLCSELLKRHGPSSHSLQNWNRGGSRRQLELWSKTIPLSFQVLTNNLCPLWLRLTKWRSGLSRVGCAGCTRIGWMRCLTTSTGKPTDGGVRVIVNLQSNLMHG